MCWTAAFLVSTSELGEGHKSGIKTEADALLLSRQTFGRLLYVSRSRQLLLGRHRRSFATAEAHLC